MNPKKLLILLPFIVLFVGCIKDDADDDTCPTSSTLYFSYTGDGLTELFPAKISNVWLYVFNTDDVLVTKLSIDRTQLSAYQGTKLTLPQGQYHVVCWGNTFSKAIDKNGTDRINAELSHPDYEGGSTVTTNDSLYYAYRLLTVPPVPVKNDTIHFQGAHIKFRVFLHGAYSSATSTRSNPSAYYIRINQLPPTYNFALQSLKLPIAYKPVGVEETEVGTSKPVFVYRFNTLRIADDNPVTIDIIDVQTEQIVHTLSLKDYMALYGIHVNGINEAIINVHFVISSIGITVLPWQDENIHPEV